MAIFNRKLLSGTPATAPTPSPYLIPDGLDCQLESCAPYASPVPCLDCVGIYLPPPPPSSLPTRQNGFENHIVPYLITMVCVLGVAFLFLTTCTILLRQRWARRRSSRRVSNSVFEDGYFDGDGSGHGPIDHPIWHIPTVGLAQSVIDSIATFKYHKYEGFVIDGSSDCSVCLTKFEDGDDLRLLPKCSHAFHVSCIDTWLRSHKNCPLCRAPVVNELASSTGGRGTNVAVFESNSSDSDSNVSGGSGSQSGSLMVDDVNLGNHDPGGGDGSGRHRSESSRLNIRETDDGFGVWRIKSIAMDEILKKQHEHFRVHSDFGVMPVEGMTMDAFLKNHRQQHLLFHSDLGVVPIEDVPMDEITRNQQHETLRANSDLYGYRAWMDEEYESIRRSMSFSFSLDNSSLRGEESSSSKQGKTTVCEKDVAGKQHEIQEHHDDDAKSGSTSSGSTKSSSIGRLLQKGPVSMKRSISSGGKFFSSFRKNKSQAARLPL